MKTYYSRGLIVVKDKFNITHLLSKIEYFCNEDETFKYVFTPSYSTISLLKSDIFQGLPGLNLDIKKEKYERINRVPVFISERVPNKNREDYYELLKEVNMEYMDPIEYLIRVKGQYFGDPYFVIAYKDKEKIDLDNLTGKYTNTDLTKIILDNIAIGNDIIFNDTLINDDNRKLIYDILIKLYKRSVTYKKEKQLEGISLAKINGKYKGRKRIEIDVINFLNYLNKINNKEITVKEACKNLGITIDKFYREKKRINKEK